MRVAARSAFLLDAGTVRAAWMLGTELPDVEMDDFTIATVPARFARLGDLHAGIDDAVWSLAPLLDWADRDAHDRGLGDAPYPPNFPKMQGEPMRVQPSRAKAKREA